MTTTTIITTPDQDARLVAAFGKILELGRDATGAEIKQHLIAYLTARVLAQEAVDERLAALATLPPSAPPTPF